MLDTAMTTNEQELRDIVSRMRDMLAEAETLLENIKRNPSSNEVVATPVTDADLRAAAMSIVKSSGSAALKAVLDQLGVATIGELKAADARSNFLASAGSIANPNKNIH